jgi:hypothetical protein
LGADVYNDPANSINILMVPVIAQFMTDIDKYEKAAGHANGEASNVDKGISFMPLEIP